jgi:hypothetical protein
MQDDMAVSTITGMSKGEPLRGRCLPQAQAAQRADAEWSGATCREAVRPEGSIKTFLTNSRTSGAFIHYAVHVTWPRRPAAYVISTQQDGKAGRSDDLRGEC